MATDYGGLEMEEKKKRLVKSSALWKPGCLWEKDWIRRKSPGMPVIPNFISTGCSGK